MNGEHEETGPGRRGVGEGEAGARGASPTPGAGLSAEPWLLVACLCLLAAAVCLWLGYFDATFVTAALGAVAWFLNVRSKLPRAAGEADAEDETTEEDETQDDGQPD